VPGRFIYFIFRVLLFFLPFPFRCAESFFDEPEVFPDLLFDDLAFEGYNSLVTLLLEMLWGSTFLDGVWLFLDLDKVVDSDLPLLPLLLETLDDEDVDSE
jgi:hypothetical protein